MRRLALLILIALLAPTSTLAEESVGAICLDPLEARVEHRRRCDGDPEECLVTFSEGGFFGLAREKNGEKTNLLVGCGSAPKIARFDAAAGIVVASCEVGEGKILVALGHRTMGPFALDTIEDGVRGGIVTDSNANNLAFVSHTNEDWAVVLNGTPLPINDAALVTGLRFDADGNLAYEVSYSRAAGRVNGTQMIRLRPEAPPAASIAEGDVRYRSADGIVHWASVRYTAELWIVIVDGLTYYIEGVAQVDALRFTQGGARVAFEVVTINSRGEMTGVETRHIDVCLSGSVYEARRP